MVFPQVQIDEIDARERRSLERFDVDFDLPDHLLPEFPAPIFLTTRPELGDVSKGEVLTIKNFFKLMNGVLTPVQMEGLRLLLTPFPQEEFNQTDGRKVVEPQFGIACLDCHTNFHTNGAFHLNPDTRPQERRFRLDTTSLRGLFNQQIHGSKRSLRSVEDFTEFEQRTAYFNGDHVSANKKGTHQPNRTNQVSLMAQMQNMIDFPPAPKLDVMGWLDPDKATEQELLGEKVFYGKGALRAVSPAAQLHGPADARSEAGALLHAVHHQRSAQRRRRTDQDLHPARHQGFTALPARWTTAHAGGHGGVLQPGAGAGAERRGEGGAGGLHAAAVNRAPPTHGRCAGSSELMPTPRPMPAPASPAPPP